MIVPTKTRKIIYHETVNGVQNFGRFFPPDQENLSNELTDNIHDNSLINPDSIVVQEEGIEGSKHDKPQCQMKKSSSILTLKNKV